MDKQQLQEFINGIGMIAETALLFYRSTLSAKATQEEAMRLTQAFIAATLYGNKGGSSSRGSSGTSMGFRLIFQSMSAKRLPDLRWHR